MKQARQIASWLGIVAQTLVWLVLPKLLPANHPWRPRPLRLSVTSKIVLVSALLGILSACGTPHGQTTRANPYSALLKEYSREQGSPTPLHSLPTDPKKSSETKAKTPSGVPGSSESTTR